MKMSDSEYTLIADIERHEEIQKLNYSKFEEWLDRILAGDNLLPFSSKLYFCIGTPFPRKRDTEWAIHLHTFSSFSANGTIDNYESPYWGDDLIWDYTWNDTLAHEDNVLILKDKPTTYLKRYLTIGKHSAKLKTFSLVAIGWMCDSPEILFERK